ncbi:virulence factor Mce family protein [Actinacidiphila rubida]|uniref:Virulence factor Mce family protein n=2 Tax=Actinacidiphila rubida TaxID=310780 RepID=A0A1H8N8T4_9ACTN|nr:MCE family protein [Actinacidiphila rubida]SEO25972.1 virulence factor Mce family protein [Actinacidiphila rubida]
MTSDRARALRALRPWRSAPPEGGRRDRRRTALRATVTVTVLALVAGAAAAAGVWAFGGPDGPHVTAYFDRTVGVYKGSDVRVLGVKVGTVASVRPQGRQVEVVLALDHGVKVPATAGAVVVAPSVVAERYVQLTPAYTGGLQLKDHDRITADRTATPVEVDQLYASITQLSDALGPDGANTTGALSRLLDVGAQNLDGNGKAIGDSIAQLGAASKTLDSHSGDLFATLSSLQSFTAMLKANDGKVRAATDQLSTVTGFLADDKADLGGALQQLSTALGQVKTFIQDNRARLRTSIAKLAPITQTLVDQRASLAELLDTAPLAADNVLNAYDPAHRTLDGRADINELSMGPSLTAAAQPPATSAATSRTSDTGAPALPLPLPAVGPVYGSKGAAR